ATAFAAGRGVTAGWTQTAPGCTANEITRCHPRNAPSRLRGPVRRSYESWRGTRYPPARVWWDKVGGGLRTMGEGEGCAGVQFPPPPPLTCENVSVRASRVASPVELPDRRRRSSPPAAPRARAGFGGRRHRHGCAAVPAGRRGRRCLARRAGRIGSPHLLRGGPRARE